MSHDLASKSQEIRKDESTSNKLILKQPPKINENTRSGLVMVLRTLFADKNASKSTTADKNSIKESENPERERNTIAESQSPSQPPPSSSPQPLAEFNVQLFKRNRFRLNTKWRCIVMTETHTSKIIDKIKSGNISFQIVTDSNNHAQDKKKYCPDFLKACFPCNCAYVVFEVDMLEPPNTSINSELELEQFKISRNVILEQLVKYDSFLRILVPDDLNEWVKNFFLIRQCQRNEKPELLIEQYNIPISLTKDRILAIMFLRPEKQGAIKGIPLKLEEESKSEAKKEQSSSKQESHKDSVKKRKLSSESSSPIMIVVDSDNETGQSKSEIHKPEDKQNSAESNKRKKTEQSEAVEAAILNGDDLILVDDDLEQDTSQRSSTSSSRLVVKEKAKNIGIKCEKIITDLAERKIGIATAFFMSANLIFNMFESDQKERLFKLYDKKLWPIYEALLRVGDDNWCKQKSLYRPSAYSIDYRQSYSNYSRDKYWKGPLLSRDANRDYNRQTRHFEYRRNNAPIE